MAPHHRFPTLPLSVMSARPLAWQGFVTVAQTRRSHRAESSSFAYGLVTGLQLLPTSSRDDAVTIGFRAGERMPGEDFHLPERVRL
jgi:hypothetical protein